MCSIFTSKSWVFLSEKCQFSAKKKAILLLFFKHNDSVKGLCCIVWYKVRLWTELRVILGILFPQCACLQVLKCLKSFSDKTIGCVKSGFGFIHESSSISPYLVVAWQCQVDTSIWLLSSSGYPRIQCIFPPSRGVLNGWKLLPLWGHVLWLMLSWWWIGWINLVFFSKTMISAWQLNSNEIHYVKADFRDKRSIRFIAKSQTKK